MPKGIQWFEDVICNNCKVMKDKEDWKFGCSLEVTKTCIEAEKLRNLMELKELRGINDELKRANKYNK